MEVNLRFLRWESGDTSQLVLVSLSSEKSSCGDCTSASEEWELLWLRLVLPVLGKPKTGLKCF